MFRPLPPPPVPDPRMSPRKTLLRTGAPVAPATPLLVSAIGGSRILGPLMNALTSSSAFHPVRLNVDLSSNLVISTKPSELMAAHGTPLLVPPFILHDLIS